VPPEERTPGAGELGERKMSSRTSFQSYTSPAGRSRGFPVGRARKGSGARRFQHGKKVGAPRQFWL